MSKATVVLTEQEAQRMLKVLTEAVQLLDAGRIERAELEKRLDKVLEFIEKLATGYVSDPVEQSQRLLLQVGNHSA